MTHRNYCNSPRELIINDPVYLIKDSYICTPCVVKYLSQGDFIFTQQPSYPRELPHGQCSDASCPDHSFLDLGSGADHSDTTSSAACLDITCECHLSIDDFDREDWDYRRSQDYDEDGGDRDAQAPL